MEHANTANINRSPGLVYSSEDSEDVRVFPGIPGHTILLPLQVELLSKGAKLTVKKVYYVGTDFLVFSRISSYPIGDSGYCILKKRVDIPHFSDFQPKDCRSIHFVECDSSHTFISTGEPFITRQVSGINEFWKYLFGIVQNPNYLNELDEERPKEETVENSEAPAPEPKTWQRYLTKGTMGLF